jgi:shikimate kinase
VAERLFLVGMMAAGKSTVARLTAKQLGWPWVDTDDLVVRETGTTIPDLFARHGEPYFRRQEARALESVRQSQESLVVSVGGGVVLDPDNRHALRESGTVVWLRARPETLIARVRDGAGRPLLAGDTPEARVETLRALDAQRRPLYEEVAQEIVDVDDIDARTVTARLLERVDLGQSHREVRR